MNEQPSGWADTAGSWLKEFCGLPLTLAREAAGYIMPSVKKQRIAERKLLSVHEAGHAAALLLLSEKIDVPGGKVGLLRTHTYARLANLFGTNTRTMCGYIQGEIPDDLENFPSVLPVVFLSGIAATADRSEEEELLLRDGLGDIKGEDWDDIIVSYNAIRTRSNAIAPAGCHATHTSARDVTLRAFGEVKKFFADGRAARFTQAIAHHLYGCRTGYSGDLRKLMPQFLERAHLDETHREHLSGHLQSINIDDMILDHFARNQQ